MTAAPPSLVIYLHGHGSDGRQFDALSQGLSRQLPQTWLVAPNAPLRIEDSDAYEWFVLSGITEQNRPWRLAEARASLDRILAKVIREHGFDRLLHRVALVGYSQGAVMALDAVMSGRWKVGGLVSLAGRLITPDPLRPPPGIRTLLLHGDQDDVLACSYTDEAYARLRGAGMPVECHVLPGLNHSMSADVLEIVTTFLRRLF